jgi:hypothetical protein
MYRTERKVLLTDEVWRETMIQAALEDKSASDICEHVLNHYVSLPQKPRIRITHVDGRQHSVYLDKALWVECVALKVEDGRSISAILEQQLRLYLGLELDQV